MTSYRILALLTLLLSFTTQATEYQWTTIRFEHSKPWSVMTNHTIKGAKIVRLNYEAADNYPLSIMLSFIPKTSALATEFELKQGVSGNVIAANFAWPLLQRFSKEVTRDNLFISFNEILVGNRLSPGAMMLVPSPQKKVYISAQAFYLDKPNYYVLGSIISRADRGKMRHSKGYTKGIDSAYKILKSVSVDYDHN